jgi:hypothetical protein
MTHTRRAKRLTLSFFVAIASLTVLFAVWDGLFGREMCNGTFEQARDAIIFRAEIPPGGTTYCVRSTARRTYARVHIAEEHLTKWLERFNHTRTPLRVGYHPSIICKHPSWSITTGWLTVFDDGGIRESIVYDSDLDIAVISSEPYRQ